MRFAFLPLCCFVGLLAIGSFPRFAIAREAAFVQPAGRVGGTVGGDAVTVDPKPEMDIGESSLNISRRVVLFFVNQTALPVEILGMSINTDSSVNSTIVSDDCSKEGKIAANSRCSVVVSLTPASSGLWSSEIILTHSGAGRIARAKITGKASGGSAADRKDTGLSLNTKEVQPIALGEVEVGSSKAVRSALVVNDSMEPITILSIDLIAAENGLERMEQGCLVDMDLKPGESCPITLSWKPSYNGAVFTDLIVRHTGKTGFIVIPVRGLAKGGQDAASSSGSSSGGSGYARGGSRANAKGPYEQSAEKIPLPPTADELEKAALDKVSSIAVSDVAGASKRGGSSSNSFGSGSSGAVFHLIGTVGNRAVLLKPDGATTIVSVGEAIHYDEGRSAKITSLAPKSAQMLIDGLKVELVLESAEELTSKAVVSHHEANLGSNKGGSNTGGGAKK